jgi:hypothetical protein
MRRADMAEIEALLDREPAGEPIAPRGWLS